MTALIFHRHKGFCSITRGKKTTIDLTGVHQWLPGQYCDDEDVYISPEGIAYCERPYDVGGRHIPIPGGHNLIQPPYLPNPDSPRTEI